MALEGATSKAPKESEHLSAALATPSVLTTAQQTGFKVIIEALTFAMH